MKLRNNIFAAAFDYLKRYTDIKTQKELARRMGVTENTITRILRDYTEVSEDIITKLQTATGCIFNLQWLRGEEDEPMLAKDKKPQQQQPSTIDQSSLVNALIAKCDETIASLKRELAAKDEVIKAKDERIEDLAALAEERLHLIAELRRTITSEHLTDYPFPVGAADTRAVK